MDIGEVIALVGVLAPLVAAVAHQVASRQVRLVSKMLAEHTEEDDARFAKGSEQFKKLNDTMGLLLFLQATQSRHTEELIRVANPVAYAEHVEPRLKKFGRNGNGE